MVKKISQLNQGTLFRLTDSETAPVWVRGGYVREDGVGKFSCTKYDDSSHEKLMIGSKEVHTGFTF